MVVTLAIGGVAVLGVLVFWLERKSRPVEEMSFRTHCPVCRQKLRFFEHQAGHSVECPRCRKRHKLPALATLRATG